MNSLDTSNAKHVARRTRCAHSLIFMTSLIALSSSACVMSVIDELKPTLNYLRYDDPYQGSFAPPTDLVFLDSETIHANKLGYKLQVVLRTRA
jgi:hypothetical protein